MAIKQKNDSNEELERECVVRLCFVRLVEGMTFLILPFVKLELSLLFFSEDSVVK